MRECIGCARTWVLNVGNGCKKANENVESKRVEENGSLYGTVASGFGLMVSFAFASSC